jgi:DNA-binding SARP family transcriptional activator
MFTITLFGRTRIDCDGRTLRAEDFPGTKPRQLLELLGLGGGAAVPKQVLADRLWEGRPPVSWPVTLGSYVSVLRRILEPGTPGRRTLIRTTPGGYRLDLACVQLDLAEFERLTDEAVRTSSPATLVLCERALHIANEDLLQDEPFAAWAVEARRSASSRRISAALCGAEAALTVDQPDRAVALARQATDADPLSEHGWQLLIEASWRAGHRADAVRAYHACRAVLRRELGLEPDPATRALFEAALAGAVPRPRGEHLTGVFTGPLIPLPRPESA